MINIGDFILHNNNECEVVNIGTNYVTVLSEGDEIRLWKRGLIVVEGKQKRNQLYKESFIFKGYKTRNFNRTLAEYFKKISLEETDVYGMLNYIRSVDDLLETTDEMINGDYQSVVETLEKVKRYSSKFGNHFVIDKCLTLVSENCVKYAILNEAKINHATTDKIMVARVIASVAGVDVGNDNNPINITNEAVRKLRTLQLTPQGWKVIGKLMQAATDIGIEWNTEMFNPSQKSIMGI